MNYQPSPSSADILSDLREILSQHSLPSYQHLIDQIAERLLMMPVERIIAGAHPMEDTVEIEDAMQEVTVLIASTFNMPPDAVNDDIVAAVNEDKCHNFRMSRLARVAGNLH